MSEKRCDTCMYWHPSGFTMAIANEQQQAGECRIGPPDRDARDVSRGRWPLTVASEFCHAHHPKEADAVSA